MDIQVLVQPVNGKYRVSGLSIEAEGATREEALVAYRDSLTAKLRSGDS